MSRYDELVSIYLKAKDEYENDGRICRDFAHDLMKSIFREFNCPAGIMTGDSRRDNEGFWKTSFWLMIVPNFPSSIDTVAGILDSTWTWHVITFILPAPTVFPGEPTILPFAQIWR